MSNLNCNSQNKSNSKANRLINEKSPYLLQHAYNPVNWYPWGDEAFADARKENKPIFLSIGYSTCHWCHVMEHESFEDSTVAEILNKYFISIKVDREERPDIDNIYMTVAQMLTGSGGWPLTIIMTPDKKPFFAGTYFPKDKRFGRPGLIDILTQIAGAWSKENDKIVASSNKITDALRQASATVSSGNDISLDILKKSVNGFKEKFDSEHGGFGSAPKFPSPHNLLFLLKQFSHSKDASILNIVTTTLDKMEEGGIFDHIGFGFHRYSTDKKWLVPHFEKMIYDQAMLAMAYTQAYQITKNEIYKSTAEKIFKYVLRDMTSKEGGFFTAEDADSDGEEGKFYFWKFSELKENLTIEDLNLFIKTYNVEEEGNFVDPMKGEKDGNNILHRTKSLSNLAKEFGISEKKLTNRLEKIREHLFAIREKRIHPLKDDKILTDWNGLMIAALADAGRIFNNQKYIDAAEKSMDFIIKNLIKSDGTLSHRYRSGEVKIDGHLDDYSFVILGLMNLYQSTFKIDYLKKAIDLNNILVNHFWDEKNGGFFFTSDKSTDLLTRQKEIYDGAIPSGNSVALINLIRLSRITGSTEIEKMASKLTKAFSQNVERYPMGYSQLLSGVDFALRPSFEIVIIGEKDDTVTKEMLKVINTNYIPNKVVILKSKEAVQKGMEEVSGFTKNQIMMGGKTTVYVCQNYVCNLPTNNTKDLKKLLKIN